MKMGRWLLVILVAVGVCANYYQTMSGHRDMTISDDYFKLRRRFLAAVEHQGIAAQSISIAARGPKDEQLFIDVAWFGAVQSREVLLHVSGTHGVEGYAGSAIQSAILEGPKLQVPEGKAVVFIHALNPWGMAHKRRFNENNVDLNRNFILEPSSFKGAPDSYRLVESFLNPSGPPQRVDLFYPEAILNLVRHGYVALKQAIAGGQYEYPRGIYFGGKKLEESSEILRDFVQNRLQGLQRLYVVEVHAGLGDWAKDVLFWPLPSTDKKTLWFEAALGEKLSSDAPEEGVGFRTPGDLQNEVPKLLPACDTYWMLQEFGAYGPIKTLRSLRDENRYHHAGGRDLEHWSKRALVETFTPGASDWQIEVQRRGIEIFEKVRRVLYETGQGNQK